MSDSPYCVYLYLKRDNPGLNFVWCLNDVNKAADRDSVFVKIRSPRYFFYALTSGFFITNLGNNYIPFRQKQLVINTWHGGGAYKKVGADIAESSWHKKYLSFPKIGRVVSSNGVFSKVFGSTFCYKPEQMLEVGLPRNDIFFNKELYASAYKKTRARFNAADNAILILYAPTFRGDFSTVRFYSDVKFFDTELDVKALKRSVKIKFNADCVLMFRLHNKQSGTIPDGATDASDYPDMQELLCAADIFITDYSSGMWDFALTYKPGFLFTPDVERYESERGVYTPISSWPFPYAKTNDELCALIENYDEKIARKKIQNHLDSLGSFEDGRATEKVCALIKERIEG